MGLTRDKIIGEQRLDKDAKRCICAPKKNSMSVRGNRLKIGLKDNRQPGGTRCPIMRKYRSCRFVLLLREAIKLYVPSSMYNSYCTGEQERAGPRFLHKSL